MNKIPSQLTLFADIVYNAHKAIPNSRLACNIAFALMAIISFTINRLIQFYFPLFMIPSEILHALPSPFALCAHHLITALFIAPLYAGILHYCFNNIKENNPSLRELFQLYDNYPRYSSTLFFIALLANLPTITLTFLMPTQTTLSSWTLLISFFLYPYLIYSFFILAIPILLHHPYSSRKAVSSSLIIMLQQMRWLVTFFLLLLTLILMSTLTYVLLIIAHSPWYTMLPIGGLTVFISAYWVIPFFFQLTTQTFVAFTQ